MALEVGHKGLTKLHVVGSMHERKALMADLSDAERRAVWKRIWSAAKRCGVEMEESD